MIDQAQFQAAVAEQKKTVIGYEPIFYDVAAMRKLFPAVRREIDRINEQDNRNANMTEIVGKFLLQTFPSGVSPSGANVRDPKVIKHVINCHFTLVC